MAITAANLQVEVGSDTGGAERGLARVENRMGKTSRRLNGLGKSMRRTGGRMSKFLTAPLLAAGAAAVKMAADFESEMAKIQGLVGASEKQVESYKDSVLAMSTEVAKSPQELAEALFFIESAGLSGQKALNALRASAKASAAGLGETKSVANAVTNALNAYAEGTLDAKDATDVLTATVREGKAEAADLAPQFGRVLPFASELQVSFDQLGGALAFFSKATGDASKAGTFLEGILRALVKPTTQSKEALNEVGLSFEDLQSMVADEGLLATLRTLRTEFEANDVSISKLFQDSNALAGVLQLTGSQAGVAEEIFGNLADATGATDKAFETASKTAKFQFDKAMASLSKTMVEAGSELLPLVANAAESLAESLSSLVDWWSNLSDTQKKIAGSLAGVVAAAGPVLFVLGTLAGSLSSIINLFGKSGTTGATGAARRFGRALGGIRAGVLIGTVIAIASEVNHLKNIFQDTQEQWEDTTDEIIRSSGSADEAIGKLNKSLEENLKEDIPHGFGEIVVNAVEKATQPWEGLRDAVEQAGDILGWVKGRGRAANAEFESTGEILPSVTQFVENLNDPLFHLPEGLRNTAGEGGPAAKAVEEVGDEAADAAMGVEEFEDALNSLFEPALSLERATIAYQDQLIELNSTLTDNKATFDLASEAGKENRSAVLDSVEAARDHAVAMINDGKGIDAATQAMQQHVEDLKKQLRQAGHSEQAIQRYIDTLNLTPEDIKTTLQAETSEAEAKIRGVRGLLDQLSGTTRTAVELVTHGFGGPSFGGALPTGHAGGIVGDLPLTAGMPRGDEQLVKARRGERLLTRGQNESFERLIGVLQSQGGQGGHREGDTIIVNNPEPRAAESDLARANRRRAYLGG